MATTVVNTNPETRPADNNGMGFLLAVILIILFVGLLLYYGLPYLQHSLMGPQINVPGNVNVNVKTNK
jgi:hypothetical protein